VKCFLNLNSHITPQAMKVLLFLASCGLASSSNANPLGKVLDLMGELEGKITKDGETEAKAYTEYLAWCDETSQNTDFAIDTAAKEKAKLEAQIGELSSDIEVGSSKIDELASASATAEKEVKDATFIREKEAADFTLSEKELVEATDALTRAVGILEKEMAKNPASFAQLDTTQASTFLQGLGAVLSAAALSSSDQKTLLALAQQQGAETDDAELSAPAAAEYKTHSSGIFDVLEDMKEKAESQLSDLRKAEVNTRHNFKMLKQSLEDQAAADTKAMEEEKADRAAAQEGKAAAEGDLEITSKELASSQQQLSTCRATCMQVAADHEATVAARKEELQVIAQAKKIVSDSSAGAVSQTYSFLQVESGFKMQTHADLAGSEVIVAVKRLAKQQHSSALAQLASRIAAVARYGASNGEEPFAKIKGLIQDMISKLEKEAGAEAEEKAYCDEQIAKTEFKKGELEDDIAKQTSKIDRAASRSAQLKGEMKELDAELAALAKEQAEMDQIRGETHADFNVAKADLENGLSGVRKALELLREYYGGSASMLQDDAKFGALMQQPAAPEIHDKSGGAGGSIIDILEVCESDFATNLAKEETEEADAQDEYEKVSQENAITKTTKDQDVKYKSQEAKSADTTVTEYSADRQASNTELSAVLEYYGKIKERCIAKPETYEERKRRRTAEIAGLKEALTILNDETAFVQRKRHGSFRGTLAA